MDRTTILVAFLSLQGSCHGAINAYQPPTNGLYNTPERPSNPCEGRTKTVTSTIPVTITTVLAGSRITDTRAILPETSFLNLPPVTTTYVVTEYEAKPQVTHTITIPPQTTWETLSRETVIITIPVFTTKTIEPLTEIKTLEKTITETMMLLTSTVISTSIVTVPPVISVIVLDGTTSALTLLPKTITSTIPIISTMKMPHCCTSTKTTKINVWTTLPPSTTDYTPTITKPAITITRTFVSTTHVLIGPKTLTETVRTTKIVREDCRPTYPVTTPSIPFTHGVTCPTCDLVHSVDLKNHYSTSVRSSTSTSTRGFHHQPPPSY